MTTLDCEKKDVCENRTVCEPTRIVCDSEPINYFDRNGQFESTWFVQDSWKPWSTYRAFGRYWKNSRPATTASAIPSRCGWRKETARTAAQKSHRKATTHHRWSATKSLSQRPANDGVVLALTRSATLSLA